MAKKKKKLWLAVIAVDAGHSELVQCSWVRFSVELIQNALAHRLWTRARADVNNTPITCIKLESFPNPSSLGTFHAITREAPALGTIKSFKHAAAVAIIR